MEKELKNGKRREFIKTSAKLAGLGVCGCMLSSLIAACDKDGETVTAPPQPRPENYPVLTLADYPALASVGGMVMVMVRDKENRVVNSGNPLIIFRYEQAKFIVLDSLCRHASALVVLPSTPGGDIICPAHNAKFDSEDGTLKDAGTASGTVPPLLKFNSMYDAALNQLTIAI